MSMFGCSLCDCFSRNTGHLSILVTSDITFIHVPAAQLMYQASVAALNSRAVEVLCDGSDGGRLSCCRSSGS